MELLNSLKKLYGPLAITGDTDGQAVDITGASVIAFELSAVVTTPGAATIPEADINVPTSTFTETAHGFLTGLVVRASSAGTLPDPLLVSTDYFVIKLTANTFKLATSRANALAGTAIALVDDGTGSLVLTPTALAGADATLQKSLGGDTPEAEWIWFDEGSAQSITGTGNFYFEKVNPSGNYYRLSYDLTAGSLDLTVRGLGKTLV